MKIKKRILIIDDVNQESEIESIKESLNGKFDIECLDICTSEPRYRQKGSQKPDVEKIKSAINKAYEDYKHFDLILSDFDLNAKGIVDGLDLIEHIKSIRENAKIIMYSGNYSIAIRKIIHKEDGKMTDQDIVDAVSKFLNYKLVECIDRTSYKKEAKKFLTNNKEMSIKDELVKLLYEHGDMTFNSCCPKFKGKKFSEIADSIANEDHDYTDEWVMALIQQTVAYLVEVNRL